MTFDELAATKPKPTMSGWSRIGYIFQMVVQFDATWFYYVRDAFLVTIADTVSERQEQRQ